MRVVAFLSNISEAKGIFYFLDTAEALLKRAPAIRVVIAGAFENSEIEQRVGERVSRLPNVTYVGAKYGEQKSSFFDSVDALLFPSVYRNEAEPVTILEANAHGIPVIASNRGCISDLISPGTGLIISQMERFAEEAADQVIRWMSDPGVFGQVSAAALESFALRRESFGSALTALKDAIVGSSEDDIAVRT